MADQRPSRGRCCNFCITVLRWLFALGSIVYCIYFISVLAHLQANNYYYFFLAIPLLIIVPVFIMEFFSDVETAYNSEIIAIIVSAVLLTSMCCFTMLTRLAYYHLDPQDKYGPGFVIVSLKGHIILIVLAFFAQRDFEVARILEDKDLLNRAVLDFVDIFDLVELLSLNECVGVGSFVSKNSHTERSIQAFCVMSFCIIFMIFLVEPESESTEEMQEPTSLRKKLALYMVFNHSAALQNIPFLVIRIVV